MRMRVDRANPFARIVTGKRRGTPVRAHAAREQHQAGHTNRTQAGAGLARLRTLSRLSLGIPSQMTRRETTYFLDFSRILLDKIVRVSFWGADRALFLSTCPITLAIPFPSGSAASSRPSYFGWCRFWVPHSNLKVRAGPGLGPKVLDVPFCLPATPVVSSVVSSSELASGGQVLSLMRRGTRRTADVRGRLLRRYPGLRPAACEKFFHLGLTVVARSTLSRKVGRP